AGPVRTRPSKHRATSRRAAARRLPPWTAVHSRRLPPFALPRHGHFLHDLFEDRAGAGPLGESKRSAADDPMREDRDDEALDVIGDGVVAPFSERQPLYGAEKGDGAARADPEGQVFVLARPADDLQQVIVDGLIDAHLADRRLQLFELQKIEDRPELLDRL